MDRTDTLRVSLATPVEPVWAEPFHEAWLEAEGAPLCLRFARGLAAELAAARAVVKPGELIVGNNALAPVVSGIASAFHKGIRFDRERLEQLRAERPEARATLDALEDYWTSWYRDNDYASPMAMHAALAYERFVERGIGGVRAYVEDCQASGGTPENAAWYESLLVTLDGVSAFVARHAEAAGQAAEVEVDPARRGELQEIADTCEHLRQGTPRTFREAVQLAYFLFWLEGHDSPGQIDRYLGPALERDLAAGAITMDEAQEIVDCLWLKYEEKTAYGATIAGILPDGSDASNRLTGLCLESTRRLRILSPRTAFRWYRGIPRAVFRHACQVIASGASLPALVNDEVMVASMVERGVALEHARDYSFVGCGQTYPHGRGHGSYEDSVMNAAKPIEWALHNGVDPVTGKREGPETGEAESLATWEDFERAYRTQMDTMVTRGIEGVNAHRARHRHHWFDPIRSLLTYSCVERGLDWHAGGADYAEGMVDMVGMSTTTDSLAAIREAVYEKGLLTLAELRDVLDRDFDDAEGLRQHLLKRIPKFGNGDPVVDAFTAAEVARVNDHIRSHRTVFGGPWGMDIIGWTGAVDFGRETGATPDGRRARQPLADCAGPAQGRNVEGPTATLASVLTLPHATSHGPLALSLRFPKDAVEGAEGVERLMALAEAYFVGGGQQLQISIASTEEMRDALVHPEAHRSLLVRFGGFSAYFTQLERVYQEDMIARSEMGT